jgi:hypothetical protein
VVGFLLIRCCEVAFLVISGSSLNGRIIYYYSDAVLLIAIGFFVAYVLGNIKSYRLTCASIPFVAALAYYSYWWVTYFNYLSGAWSVLDRHKTYGRLLVENSFVTLVNRLCALFMTLIVGGFSAGPPQEYFGGNCHGVGGPAQWFSLPHETLHQSLSFGIMVALSFMSVTKLQSQWHRRRQNAT